MKPSTALNAHRDEIRGIALSHRVSNIRVFGSAARGDDTDGSDLDLLVDPTQETTLMDIGAIRFELRRLLGIPVDVLTPKSLPPKFREHVLEEAAFMSRAEELRPMRNVLAHGYFMVDMEIVWKTIKNDLPNMAAQISHLMKTP